MAKHILNIDGYIGQWGYSQQWLAEMLKGHEKDEVVINMSSLGGRFDHALNMHDQLRQHGNVTVNFTGFNASSSTIIGMGAKTRRMSENSLFLVHKVMSWVDEFGFMNEDNIEELIAKLEKEKNENAKMTLVLANIYHKRTGKPIAELLDLMKQDTWLNADETKEWAFVDEVFDPGQGAENIFNDLAKVAMIEANGLPMPKPKIRSFKDIQAQYSADNFEEEPIENIADNASFVKKLASKLTEYFSPKTSKMEKQFEYINSALEVEALESSGNGVFLNQDQLSAIDNLINEGEQHALKLVDVEKSERKLNEQLETETQAREKAEADLAERQNELTNAVSEKEKLQADNLALLAGLGEIHESIAKAETPEDKLNAIRAIIAAKPGARATGVQTSQDPTTRKNDGVDWETLNSLPHMQEQQ
jgi:ATP-dependent Clp protease, protease subunit